MQYFFITCIWIVYTPYLTSASSSDLFSPGPGNDETDLLAMNDPIDLSFIENSDALSSSLDDNNLFTTDKIFSPTNVVDANGSDFLDQSSADLILNNDPFLLTDTSSPDSCHSSLSKTRKIRMRSSNICSASEQQQNGGQSSFPSSSQELNSITSMAVAKAVDASIRRKWCSSSGVQGFGNIPVCNVGEFGGEMENSEEKAVEAAGLDVDDASVAASPFRNLLSCHLCEIFSPLFFYVFIFEICLLLKKWLLFFLLTEYPISLCSVSIFLSYTKNRATASYPK